MYRVCFLYAQAMPYIVSCFKELSKNPNTQILIISWKAKGNHPTQPLLNRSNVTHIYKDKFEKDGSLKEKVLEFNPSCLYVSGWMDKDYLKVAKHLYNQIPTICGLDTQMRQFDLRQKVAIFSSPFYLKKIFSHIWVAGPRQKKYANKLGFSGDQILNFIYSCDSDKFSSIYSRRNNSKKEGKTLLFIGRDHPDKGIDLLQDAFKELSKTQKNGWKLLLIGPPESNEDDIVSVGYKSQDEIEDYLLLADAGIIPSRKEPWGVVLHEYVTCGLPVIASDACGSSEVFIEDDKNGYIFESNSLEKLKQALTSMFNCTEAKLHEFSDHSHQLSLIVTNEKWVNELISLLDTTYNS